MGSIGDWFRTIAHAVQTNSGVQVALFALVCFALMAAIGKWIGED